MFQNPFPSYKSIQFRFQDQTTCINRRATTLFGHVPKSIENDFYKYR